VQHWPPATRHDEQRWDDNMITRASRLAVCLIVWLAVSQLSHPITLLTSADPLKVFTQQALAQEPRPAQGGTTAHGLRPDVELIASDDGFEFNGIDEGINLGHSSIVDVAAGDFTLHAWVKFKSLTEGGPPCFGHGCDMSIVDKMARFVFTNDDGWRLLKQSDNRIYFCLGGGASGNGCHPGLATTVVSQTAAVPHLWFSVAAVKTTSSISIYVNGKLEASSEYGAFVDTNAADLLVGANTPEGAFLHGYVGEVDLFRRALNDGQVRAIYARSKATHRP
jgi:hypothetical protein